MLKVKKTFKFELHYSKYAQIYEENISELDKVVYILALGHKLHKKYKDHALHGKWKGFRECHIIEVSDDWLMIYRVTKHSLLLVDTGTHKELFSEE